MILGMYFFSGSGMVVADTVSNNILYDAHEINVVNAGIQGAISNAPGKQLTPIDTPQKGNEVPKKTNGTEMDALIEAEKKNAIEDQEAVDIRTAEILKETERQGSSTKPVWSPEDMTSENFRLDPGFLTPSEKQYGNGKQYGGTIQNLKTILANIGKYLLIATTTIAVLSIVVGGLMISTTGPTDRAAKWKTIIMLNIMAIIVALFSYSIIRLVSWIIA